MVKSFIQTIDLDAVVADDTYRISRKSGIDTLVESLRCVGVINSPVFEEVLDGYRIVCGFKRIEACRILGIRRLPCKIVVPSCSRIDCLKLAIADNVMRSGLNLLEEAVAVVKLWQLCDDRDQVSRIAASLGIRVSSDLAEKYRRLCMLPGRVCELVGDDIISLKIALELEKLDPVSAIAVAGLFETVRPTTGHQRELLANLKGISVNLEKPVSELLASQALREIREDETLDRRQKIAALRDKIKKMRYPYITAFESRFYKNLGKLELPAGVELIPPRDFESRVYSFTIQFTDTDELANKAKQVQELSIRKEMLDILNRTIED